MNARELRLIPFALGMLCGGVVVGILLDGARRSERVHSHPEIVAGVPAGAGRAEAHEARSLPQVGHVESADARRVSIESEPADERVTLLEQLPARIPTPEQLEKRYRDFSLLELKGAEKGMKHVLHEESQAFLEKKMELGQFTTQILPLGVPFEQSGQFPDGASRATRTVWNQLGDGTAEVWIADIHPKEQPMLEARHAEVAWLGARVWQLEKGVK